MNPQTNMTSLADMESTRSVLAQAPQPLSEIDEQLESLNSTNTELCHAITALEGRLKSVIKLKPGKEQSPQVPRNTLSPLGETIFKERECAQMCVSRIRDILSDLAL